jgi:hypothetical protein
MPASCCATAGFVEYLAGLPGYDPQALFSPDKVQVWEALLVKLKEFELFHGIRRLVVSVQQQDNALVLVDRSLNRTWVGGPPTIEVSSATGRSTSWRRGVVDPQISRFGMIYDVTDFSHIVSLLRRASSEEQDRSFRQMFRFQRRVHRLATSQRLKLEKYLGDGAFYSARDAFRMLVVALQVQRFYRQALEEGFPFNRGMRIALNFAQYRLLPIHGGGVGEPERYEFFGHGVVELSRLTTGKSMRELEEFKVLLVNLGYPEADGAPLLRAARHRRGRTSVDKREERRSFYAYINRNGNLVNEGIVATSQLCRATRRRGGGAEAVPARYEGRELRRARRRAARRPLPRRRAQARHRQAQRARAAGDLRARRRRPLSRRLAAPDWSRLMAAPDRDYGDRH